MFVSFIIPFVVLLTTLQVIASQHPHHDHHEKAKKIDTWGDGNEKIFLIGNICTCTPNDKVDQKKGKIESGDHKLLKMNKDFLENYNLKNCECKQYVLSNEEHSTAFKAISRLLESASRKTLNSAHPKRVRRAIDRDHSAGMKRLYELLEKLGIGGQLSFSKNSHKNHSGHVFMGRTTTSLSPEYTDDEMK